MILYKNGIEMDHLVPEYTGRSVFVAIDSSKSNSAMVVGTPDGIVLDDYEFNGAGRDVDVYDLCRDTREQLKLLFAGATIVSVGIEDIITKNGYHKGDNSKNKFHSNMSLEVHQSRAKITAVFNNFIFAFEEFFGIRPTLINNWEWKSRVLPEEYRTREHHKGSQDYLPKLSVRWLDRSDDVTDAACIYLFMLDTIKYVEIRSIIATEVCSHSYKYRIAPISAKLEDGRFVPYAIQNDDTLEHNMGTIANRLQDGQLGYFELDTSRLSLEQIYKAELYLPGGISFDKSTDRLYIIVEKGG